MGTESENWRKQLLGACICFSPISHLQHSLRENVQWMLSVHENWRKSNKMMELWNWEYQLLALLSGFLHISFLSLWNLYYSIYFEQRGRPNLSKKFSSTSAFIIFRLWTKKVEDFQNYSGNCILKFLSRMGQRGISQNPTCK